MSTNLTVSMMMGSNAPVSDPGGTHGLTVGTSAGSYGFVSASYGAVAPTDLNGIEFQRVVANTGDAVQVAFAAGAQQGTSEVIRMTFPDFNNGTAFDLTWNSGESVYEGTVAGFLAFLTAENGNTIPFTPVALTTALIAASTLVFASTEFYPGGVLA